MSADTPKTPPADDAASSPRALPALSPGVLAVVVALLLVFSGLAVRGAWVKSETYDEPFYIFTAYSYVMTGDLSLNREHPPLAKYLMGLPLLLLDIELPEDYQRKPGQPYSFIAHQPRADHHLMLFLPRLPGIALGILAGLYVFAWARRAFGVRAGLAALSLYALNPNMLGHSRVAANDFAVTTFALAAMYHVWCWLEAEASAARGQSPQGAVWRPLALSALMLSAALGSKLTALLLLPVIGVLVLVATLVWKRPALLGRSLLAGAAALGLLYLLYGGEARPLSEARQHARFLARGSNTEVFNMNLLEEFVPKVFGEDTPVPMLSLLKGIDHQFAHGKAGHPTYFHGEVIQGGVLEFYVVSWLIKNPEALSLLLLLGVLCWRRTSRGWVHEVCLWGFVCVQFALFSTADVQLGFKYVLPVVPLLCVAASRVWADDSLRSGHQVRAGELRLGAALVMAASVMAFVAFGDKGSAGWRQWVPLAVPLVFFAWTYASPRRRAWAAAPATQSRAPLLLLLLWAGGASLLRQPDNLMYFNEWVGGPENGWRWSVVGDDWGQDTAGLARWMEAHDVEHIYYDYYGTGDPEVWGVTSTPTHTTPRRVMPVEGLVAVHVAMLARAPGMYRWLADREPVAKIGNTIFIFDVDALKADVKGRVEAVRQVLPPLGSG